MVAGVGGGGGAFCIIRGITAVATVADVDVVCVVVVASDVGVVCAVVVASGVGVVCAVAEATAGMMMKKMKNKKVDFSVSSCPLDPGEGCISIKIHR